VSGGVIKRNSNQRVMIGQINTHIQKPLISPGSELLGGVGGTLNGIGATGSANTRIGTGAKEKSQINI
jgi:hypothetical protein